jgi:hypothetical protein
MTNDITMTTTNVPVAASNLTDRVRHHRDRIDEVRTHFSKVVNFSYNSPEQRIKHLQQYLVQFDTFAETELPTIQDEIDRALNEPATSEEIDVEVAKLVGSFPNVTKNDLAMFSHQLSGFLEDWQVGRGMLSLAMRHLTLTCEFLPTIAKVREALKETQQDLLKSRMRLLGDPEQCHAGVYGFRHSLQRQLDDATGETARREEAIDEERRRKEQEKIEQERAKVKADAEETYIANLRWSADIIPSILANSKHNAEEKNKQIAKVMGVVADAREKWEQIR